MTQQEFTESLETALSWMQAIQERLKANDNTQGPREALEARLRETEVSCFTNRSILHLWPSATLVRSRSLKSMDSCMLGI